MSQLEMGSLAVASFGKEGSIKMLHDFDQSFTTESGIKVSCLKTLPIFPCSVLLVAYIKTCLRFSPDDLRIDI